MKEFNGKYKIGEACYIGHFDACNVGWKKIKITDITYSTLHDEWYYDYLYYNDIFDNAEDCHMLVDSLDEEALDSKPKGEYVFSSYLSTKTRKGD